MPGKPDLAAVFVELRNILIPYAERLVVVRDAPGDYYLDMHTTGPNGKPIMFAGVRTGKNYVSFYFMPIYGRMQEGIPDGLKKRMQGKACFNFTEADPVLMKQLKTLTRKGFADWKKLEWV